MSNEAWFALGGVTAIVGMLIGEVVTYLVRYIRYKRKESK